MWAQWGARGSHRYVQEVLRRDQLLPARGAGRGAAGQRPRLGRLDHQAPQPPIRRPEQTPDLQLALGHRRRGVVVGRAKIEPRPVVRCDFALAEDPTVAGQLFLQQAETVRLATLEAGGAAGALPVTVAATASNSAAALPQVRVRTSVMGTHVGRAIKARVNER